MLKSRSTPKPGSFDYLLDPIRDQLHGLLPPPRGGNGGGGGPIRIEIEIVDRRGQKQPRRTPPLVRFAQIVTAGILVGWLLAGCTAYQGPLASAYGIQRHDAQMAAQPAAAQRSALDACLDAHPDHNGSFPCSDLTRVRPGAAPLGSSGVGVPHYQDPALAARMARDRENDPVFACAKQGISMGPFDEATFLGNGKVLCVHHPEAW